MLKGVSLYFQIKTFPLQTLLYSYQKFFILLQFMSYLKILKASENVAQNFLREKIKTKVFVFTIAKYIFSY